jgi:hypothetical protein
MEVDKAEQDRNWNRIRKDLEDPITKVMLTMMMITLIIVKIVMVVLIVGLVVLGTCITASTSTLHLHTECAKH